MSDEVTFQKKEKKVYKVVLIMLIGLASISGAKKDLNQLLSLVTEVRAFASHLSTVLPVNEAHTAPPAGVCQVKERTTFVHSVNFPWTARTEQVRSIKIKGLRRDIKTINGGGIAIFIPAEMGTEAPGDSLNDPNAPVFPLNVIDDEAKAFERHDWQWRTQAGLEDANR